MYYIQIIRNVGESYITILNLIISRKEKNIWYITVCVICIIYGMPLQHERGEERKSKIIDNYNIYHISTLFSKYLSY